jgi:hypothetical protein
MPSPRESIWKAGQERPGIFALKDAKPPLGNLTKAMGCLSSKMQSLGFGSEAFSVGERHPVQESPPHGFRPI